MEAWPRWSSPPDLPAIPGLDLGVYFHPGGDLVIGGDFYDVFPIRDTKNAEPTGSGLLVGDVCGTGPEADAITGLVRYTARALARMGLPPTEVLTQVNAALLDRGAREDRFCTGIFAVVTPQGDGGVLRLTNGGHPAPLLRQHGSSAAAVEVEGQLLGVFETISLSEEVIELGADDTIMFYTDGVTEARANGEQFGEERLLTVLNDADGASAAEIAGHVVRTTGGVRRQSLRRHRRSRHAGQGIQPELRVTDHLGKRFLERGSDDASVAARATRRSLGICDRLLAVAGCAVGYTFDIAMR
jgi:serine phosphatase RsbU (regulator of sigma subunit)